MHTPSVFRDRAPDNVGDSCAALTYTRAYDVYRVYRICGRVHVLCICVRTKVPSTHILACAVDKSHPGAHARVYSYSYLYEPAEKKREKAGGEMEKKRRPHTTNVPGVRGPRGQIGFGSNLWAETKIDKTHHSLAARFHARAEARARYDQQHWYFDAFNNKKRL